VLELTLIASRQAVFGYFLREFRDVLLIKRDDAPQCRSHGEPVLYLDNPPGVDRPLRRKMLDAIDQIDQQTYDTFGNPETVTRVAQYEMAFRMQMDATDAMDIHKEPDSVRAKYGSKPGEASFANNCLVARRLAERGVRFIQLYHWGWDSHGADAKEALNLGFADRCREVDQPTAALLADLKERGMLEDTLVVWGGEFGRTPMRENRNGQEMKYVGRDHNPGVKHNLLIARQEQWPNEPRLSNVGYDNGLGPRLNCTLQRIGRIHRIKSPPRRVCCGELAGQNLGDGLFVPGISDRGRLVTLCALH